MKEYFIARKQEGASVVDDGFVHSFNPDTCDFEVVCSTTGDDLLEMLRQREEALQVLRSLIATVDGSKVYTHTHRIIQQARQLIRQTDITSNR